MIEITFGRESIKISKARASEFKIIKEVLDYSGEDRYFCPIGSLKEFCKILEIIDDDVSIPKDQLAKLDNFIPHQCNKLLKLLEYLNYQKSVPQFGALQAWNIKTQWEKQIGRLIFIKIGNREKILDFDGHTIGVAKNTQEKIDLLVRHAMTHIESTILDFGSWSIPSRIYIEFLAINY